MPQSAPPLRSRRTLTVVLLTIGLVAIVTVPFFFPAVRATVSPENLAGIAAEAGVWGPVAIVGAMIAAIVISPLPSVPITAVAGMAYGPWIATPIAAVGATAGALAAFCIARRLGHHAVRRLTGEPVVFCAGCPERTMGVLVLASRLVPILSFDLVSYGAGLSTLSAGRFAVMTFLGLLPWTLVYASLGSALIRRPGLTAAAGVVLGVGILMLPAVIRRYNPFGLRRFFVQESDNGGPLK